MQGSAFDQRPKTQDLKVWEVTDNVTWIAGRHIVKLGGKFRRWVPLFTDSKQYAGQSAYALFQTAIQTSSQAGLPLSITKTDRAQIGPRIGFAWQPFSER